MHAARFVAAAALVAVAFAAPVARAALSDVETMRVTSGQTYEGFIVDVDDAHVFLIEDFGLQTFSISLKASRGSLLLPDLTLHDPSDVDITSSLDPFRRDGAKSVSVRNAAFPGGEGRHVLRVFGKTGSTGGYLLKVTAKTVKKFKGTGLVETGGGTDDTSFAFFAPTEATVSVKAVPAAGSTIVPAVGAVTGSPCAVVSVTPGLTQGTATFRSPLSSVHVVPIEGDSGTAGAFNWLAKVKAAKPSRKAVRVNGGAAYVAPSGPAPATRVVGPGQAVNGFAVDATELCWREYRVSGGGGNLGRNEISCSTLTGASPNSLENNLATDQTPPDHCFAIGRDYAVAVAANELWAVPRGNGGAKDSLDGGVGAVLRVVADDVAAYTLLADGIRRYGFPSDTGDPISTIGGATYLDMAVGGKGIVYALETGGDLEIRTMANDGADDELLATLSPNPGFHALAARGPDAYFSVQETTGFRLYRASTCDPGNAVSMTLVADGPARAMAADELNVYVLVDDAVDGIRVAQCSRGGGVATVIARSNLDASYSLDDLDLAAVGGYVYFLADDGSANFYRVKRY
jgi:hypothetical protein